MYQAVSRLLIYMLQLLFVLVVVLIAPSVLFILLAGGLLHIDSFGFS